MEIIMLSLEFEAFSGIVLRSRWLCDPTTAPWDSNNSQYNPTGFLFAFFISRSSFMILVMVWTFLCKMNLKKHSVWPDWCPLWPLKIYLIPRNFVLFPVIVWWPWWQCDPSASWIKEALINTRLMSFLASGNDCYESIWEYWLWIESTSHPTTDHHSTSRSWNPRFSFSGAAVDGSIDRTWEVRLASLLGSTCLSGVQRASLGLNLPLGLFPSLFTGLSSY